MENQELPQASVEKGGKQKKKRSLKKILMMTMTVILAVGLLVWLSLSLHLDYLISLLSYQKEGQPISPDALAQYLQDARETMAPDFVGEVIEPEDVVLETIGQVQENEQNVVNILLIGHDTRPGEGRARSDTMLLCSLNQSTGELTMVSFLRDMYVHIPDYCDHKMNGAYAWGDMQLLNETLLVNFGIEVHGDFAVSFSAFEAVLDRIGGVDIYLTAAEAAYLNRYRYCEGINHLNGADALRHARNRSIGDADFSRTSRQQAVIRAVMEKCKTMSLIELNSLMETLLPLVETNMKPEQVKNYASLFLPMIANLKVKDGLQIPAEGTYTYAWVGDMSVLMPDLAENRKVLQNAIYGS